MAQAAHEKQTLRRLALATRAQLGQPRRRRAAADLAYCLSDHRLVRDLAPNAVLVPATHRDEIDTQPLAMTLEDQGWRICRPRVAAPDRLDVVPWPVERHLEPGYRGVPEPPPEAKAVSPTKLGLVLVPGVAFAPDGARLGTGGGFFDRFLAPLVAGPNPPRVIGIGFEEQLVARLPSEPHDVPMHGLQLGVRGFVTLRDDAP